MALTRRTPITIAIHPSQPRPDDIRADRAAVETITPGMLIELHNDATYGLCYGVQDSANEPSAKCVALDQIEMNKTIDETYAAGDLVKAWYMKAGDIFFGIIPSGQNITQGALLQSNGDGKLKAWASGAGGYVAASSPGAVVADTRIWVEVL